MNSELMMMTSVKIPQAYEELLNIPNDLRDDAYKYCVMVLSGAYITCKDTRLACIRHLKDIHKSIENDEWNYTYKPKRAKKVIKFIEALPDPKGNINKLGLFQKFIISSVRGWFTKDTDMLRFKKSFISMARKQGKYLPR